MIVSWVGWEGRISVPSFLTASDSVGQSLTETLFPWFSGHHPLIQPQPFFSVFPNYLFHAGLLRVGCHLASLDNLVHALGIGCLLYAVDPKFLSRAQVFLAPC